jgi:hypothetical protein
MSSQQVVYVPSLVAQLILVAQQPGPEDTDAEKNSEQKGSVPVIEQRWSMKP